ncbi:4'-phosphopantetheinyl transferase superfamily protein [Marinobacter sp. ATCH36]|uniref:4'-phosphopantetheinyl transferase family protein n=1 Tax=Marinobacter sp. ATCH36 TaxID=2945106 RepID=UPI00202109FA|nr:4'-phosphopantetheinyl transferase superfamily protein [Marinobacter sp. ATCH36]MCL7942595.1 4'-phosphopantetheinyl transferase superfamily protein [Marinobacter sp. ATCH36]
MTGSSPDSAPIVWLCREPASLEQQVPGWLTAFEQTSVAGFEGLRRREYLCSRWLIRQALAGTSGTAASECRPIDGRPVCSEHPPGWHLSLSHSHGLSACAVSAKPGLGLDIEPCSRHPHWQKVVRRWFTPSEQDWLLNANRCENFLKVWTLKEAWLKATGRGIAGNLQTLEVTPDFRLFGDRNDESWMASAGQVGDFLVALVYHQHGPSLPVGYLLQTPDEPLEAGQRAGPIAQVNWLLHNPVIIRKQE